MRRLTALDPPYEREGSFMENGWIKLHRKMLDWEWYQDTNVFRVFVHCIFKANWKDKRWRGVEIPRGSFITSLANLSKETSLSVRQVRVALDKLILTGEVTKETTNTYTAITVVNYSKYQVDDTQNDKRVTNGRQTDDKRMTTTEEVKKVRSISKDIGAEYGSVDINRFLKGIDKHLPYKLPVDRRTRLVAHTILTIMTKSGKSGVKKGREWMNEDKWENIGQWIADYCLHYADEGYGAKSWYKLMDHAKLWIANGGAYPTK